MPMTNEERTVMRTLLRRCEAQAKLLVAYRVGGRTPGAAIDTLNATADVEAKARDLLAS